MNDAEIIGLFWERSENALSAFSQKYGGLIYRTAENILGSIQDALECQNDTYLGLWRAIPPEKPESLAAYSVRMTRNIALNRRRAGKTRKQCDALPLEDLENYILGASAEDHCSAQELGQALNRFLEKLDPENRAIFLRRYWFSDSIETIAKKLGHTENIISVRLHRIRNKLKKFLEQEGYL